MKIRLLTLTASALAFTLAASPSYAQVRTFVSGIGNDADPCSRTAPCRTFSGALTKTQAGGEINCLDPGGYGAATIGKSITIDCIGTMGSSLASGTTGFTINAAGIIVTLRNLAINGGISSSPGINGIRFVSGARLTVENVNIFNFNSGSPNGFGINFQPIGAAQLFVTNSTINNNGTGATGGGILIDPASGAAGNARVQLRNVRIDSNANFGVRIDTTGNTSAVGTLVVIEDSQISGNANGVSMLAPAGAAGVRVMLRGSTVSNNTSAGLVGDGISSRMRVGDTIITNNGTGVSILNSSVINTYGTNQLDQNGVDGTFTAPAILEE